MQFVDPSFLQQTVIPRPLSVAPPASQPASTMSPRVSLDTISATNSPRLDDKQTPPQTAPAKPHVKDSRRPSSGTGVTKSPVPSHSSTHAETLPLLLCVAEDCFAKANAAAQRVARSMSADEVNEHHKLVATGLGCLEMAMMNKSLSPRLEARLCMRYASILVEETTNLMEAETALTRGIAVCEKHRFTDLKYSSLFLLMKTLFQRNQKAAFRAIDTHIADCTTYQHIHWVYAFRFLKASLHLQSGTAADHNALDNLRRIAAIANQREEKAVFVMATLLEGLAHLGTTKEDWATRVQTCIAQASKLQLDDSAHLPQIDVLLLLLDLACSLRQKSHQISGQKLSALQGKMEELNHSPDWVSHSNEVLLPIRRTQITQQTISNDTRAILRPGEGAVDYLVLSALGKQESYALVYVFQGIVALYKATTLGRSSAIWSEAARLLEEPKPFSTIQPLPEALKQAGWAKELYCYAHILVGLQAATLCDWAKVKMCLQLIEKAQAPAGFLDLMTLYLSGVLHQGTADLPGALRIWTDPRFQMDSNQNPKTNPSQIESELSILAALNRLWIMQEPNLRDDAETADVMEMLRPLCEDNPDQEIRTAYNLVLASITIDPPLSINQVKRHIQNSLAGAQQTTNTHFLSIALNIMRFRLFENVVGDQALKSARAGSAQAKKSGNLLWMSVADGMLSQSHEVQGAFAEAHANRESGIRLANEALMKTKV
ncbi:cohesin loading factor [Cercophora scortea]|uniref:Cohesin loading factor n=1 Tax=Cercophora scortea TaxID=314031 RepID=A0AAE0MDB7_9PEZI|nr:cohesin loading factor [Cercophora scortea]